MKRLVDAMNRSGRLGTTARDHPLPSGCAFSLRIDEPREGGHGAPHAPDPR